jgi:hypothetical protein
VDWESGCNDLVFVTVQDSVQSYLTSYYCIYGSRAKKLKFGSLHTFTHDLESVNSPSHQDDFPARYRDEQLPGSESFRDGCKMKGCVCVR